MMKEKNRSLSEKVVGCDCHTRAPKPISVLCVRGCVWARTQLQNIDPPTEYHAVTHLQTEIKTKKNQSQCSVSRTIQQWIWGKAFLCGPAFFFWVRLPCLIIARPSPQTVWIRFSWPPSSACQIGKSQAEKKEEHGETGNGIMQAMCKHWSWNSKNAILQTQKTRLSGQSPAKLDASSEGSVLQSSLCLKKKKGRAKVSNLFREGSSAFVIYNKGVSTSTCSYSRTNEQHFKSVVVS